jgi:hypothetical protein
MRRPIALGLVLRSVPEAGDLSWTNDEGLKKWVMRRFNGERWEPFGPIVAD